MARRAVVDTNVLVAALRSQSGAGFQIVQSADRGIWEPCVSVTVALEYEDVLKRSFMEGYLTSSDVDDFLNYWISISHRVESPYRLRPALRDPDDDRILELAARAGATVVTYNVRDFTGAERFGVAVRTPVQFLRELGVLQ